MHTDKHGCFSIEALSVFIRVHPWLINKHPWPSVAISHANDYEELSQRAADILEQQRVTLPVEVACEVVYVLQKVYSVSRDDIAEQLTRLVQEELIFMDKSAVFLKALDCYRHSNLDVVDCLLWGYHHDEQQEIFTFDKKLHRLIYESAPEHPSRPGRP